MQKQIRLAKIPGRGITQIVIDTDWTIQQLADKYDLSERDITLDGVMVEKSQWGSRRLGNVDQVFATRASKGA